jgi:hypothetical protein
MQGKIDNRKILTVNKNRYSGENETYQREAVKRVNINPARVLVYMLVSV